MPGRRRTSPPSGGRAAASKRAKVTAAYRKRNDAAVAKGYASYYDFRVHNNGRIPPAVPAPRGEALARLRGHRSVRDLEKSIRAGSLVMALGAEKDEATGRLKQVEIVVVDPRTSAERRFVLKGAQASPQRLEALIGKAKAQGGVIGLWYPRRLKAAA